jgi:hypothetical protein
MPAAISTSIPHSFVPSLSSKPHSGACSSRRGSTAISCSGARARQSVAFCAHAGQRHIKQSLHHRRDVLLFPSQDGGCLQGGSTRHFASTPPRYTHLSTRGTTHDDLTAGFMGVRRPKLQNETIATKENNEIIGPPFADLKSLATFGGCHGFTVAQYTSRHFLFAHKYREPIYRLIPVCGRIILLSIKESIRTGSFMCFRAQVDSTV